MNSETAQPNAPTTGGNSIRGVSADDSFFLATIALEEGDSYRALEHLNDALAQDPRHFWALASRVYCDTDPERAQRDVQKILAMRPECPASYYAALQVPSTFDSNELKSILDDAVRVAPEDVWLLNVAAGYYTLITDDHAKARIWAERAVTVRRDGDNLGRLGTILHKLGESEEAFRHLDQAIELSSNKTRWLREKAFRLMQDGRYGEAVDVALQARSSNPSDPWALHVLAQIYAKKGDLRSAVQLLYELKEMDAQAYTRQPCYMILSGHLVNLGQIDAAEQELAEGIRLADQYGANSLVHSHRHQLAVLRSARLGPGAGEAVFKEVLRQYEHDPIFWSWYGWYHFLNQQYMQAERMLHTAISLCDKRPDMVIARKFLIRILRATDRVEDTLRELDILIEDVPTDPGPYQDKVELLTQLERYEEAVSIAQVGIDRCGQKPAFFVSWARHISLRRIM